MTLDSNLLHACQDTVESLYELARKDLRKSQSWRYAILKRAGRRLVDEACHYAHLGRHLENAVGNVIAAEQREQIESYDPNKIYSTLLEHLPMPSRLN